MLGEYDRIVNEAGDQGITVKDAQARLAEAYQQGIESGEIQRPDEDLFAEGKGLFDRIIRPTRQQRKNSLQRDMEHITSALNGETILGDHDPALHLAYPLGTSDGRDKVLSLWTREDWRNAAMTRYRNAAEVTAAAQIFEEQATIISDRMLAAGAGTTGELFPESMKSAS